MENSQSNHSTLQRHLSALKLVSRLLGHELHSQGGTKTITLSREEVHEVQTAIDLFIEEMGRRSGQTGSTISADSLVPTRN